MTEIVEGCTDSQVIPKPPWKDRKLAYIAGISEKSASVRLVCAADKLHNARSILGDYRAVGNEVWARFRGSREETLWYYREVTKALIRSGRTPLVDEIERLAGGQALVLQLPTERRGKPKRRHYRVIARPPRQARGPRQVGLPPKLPFEHRPAGFLGVRHTGACAGILTCGRRSLLWFS